MCDKGRGRETETKILYSFGLKNKRKKKFTPQDSIFELFWSNIFSVCSKNISRFLSKLPSPENFYLRTKTMMLISTIFICMLAGSRGKKPADLKLFIWINLNIINKSAYPYVNFIKVYSHFILIKSTAARFKFKNWFNPIWNTLHTKKTTNK